MSITDVVSQEYLLMGCGGPEANPELINAQSPAQPACLRTEHLSMPGLKGQGFPNGL